MAKSTLKVATIVGSSTETAWSQTYHAGGVIAIASVKPKEGQESQSLSLVGKDILNTFESEYFTLETKNLASIKDAVEITYKKSQDTHNISLLVASCIQNAIYLILAGEGKILLIRKETLATLLEQKEEAVISASGFLEDGDIVILETQDFSEKISSSLLLDTLSTNTVSESTEILSPTIHKEKLGAATAMFASYKEEGAQEMTPIPNASEETPKQEESQKEEIETPLLSLRVKGKLTHRQRLFLTIAIILVVVLGGTVYFSLQKKQTSQENQLFQQIYPPAEKKYEEAQGLQGLNATLAHSDYVDAQQMLEGGKNKFPANSSEEKQILSLLEKINAQLTPTNASPSKTETSVVTGTDDFLAFAAKHSDTRYLAQDDSNYYMADSNGISKVDKSGGTAKQIIQNGGDWKTLGGFATYLGNMYILDTSDGIDKYPVTANGFGDKAAYFSGSAPYLSKATSIAIDGSIWILSTDGSILKYTKGSKDSFTTSGLMQSLASPSQIVTSVDDNNVYILDNGNSRLVVFKKDGSFVADYYNSIISKATELDVNESAKKAYILSGGNIYELDMK